MNENHKICGQEVTELLERFCLQNSYSDNGNNDKTLFGGHFRSYDLRRYRNIIIMVTLCNRETIYIFIL